MTPAAVSGFHVAFNKGSSIVWVSSYQVMDTVLDVRLRLRDEVYQEREDSE